MHCTLHRTRELPNLHAFLWSKILRRRRRQRQRQLTRAKCFDGPFLDVKLAALHRKKANNIRGIGADRYVRYQVRAQEFGCLLFRTVERTSNIYVRNVSRNNNLPKSAPSSLLPEASNSVKSRKSCLSWAVERCCLPDGFECTTTENTEVSAEARALAKNMLNASLAST